jgi:hypothetical protein
MALERRDYAMKRMMVGAMISLVLAYSVLSLLGFYQGNTTPLQILSGLVLAGVYLIVFRAGSTKKQREDLVWAGSDEKKVEEINVGAVRSKGAMPKVSWDADIAKSSVMQHGTSRLINKDAGKREPGAREGIAR